MSGIIKVNAGQAGLIFVLAAAVMLQGCARGGNGAERGPESPRAASPEPSASAGPSAGDAGPSLELRIHVNQVGYSPEGAKLVVVAADEAFPELRVAVVGRDGIAWEGMLPAARRDANSGDWIAQADFGEVRTEGTYRVEAEGNASVPFMIRNGAYRELFEHVARSYRLQRSGEAIDDPELGLRLLPGHMQDKEAVLYYEDENGERPVIDVSGGWYDAGDYGKYVPPAAVTAAQLLLAYELRPEKLAELRFLAADEKTDWPAADRAPDVLIETKFELDWMLRMQRADGAVYHKVSGGTFPGFILPAEDVQDRNVYGLSSYGTAMFAGAAAMGARIYEPFDEAYAKRLLQAAERAQTWLDEHPEAYFRMDEGQNSGSGPYDKFADREERLWALAELLKTTGDARYAARLADGYADLAGRRPASLGWSNGQLLGQWALATASGADPTAKAAATEAILGGADAIVARIETDGYRSALAAGEYVWASNKIALAHAVLLLLAGELEPKAEYAAAAADQLHYVLGRNAMGTSYVTGAGTVYPFHPHHRISAASGVLVPGLLVGGPNRQMNDPVLEKLAHLGLPPAKSYVDDLFSYASNEYAIDYNAPLFFTLAWFDS
ncbi:glycoside hydrolase family 9 protein [Paenibacillaceae bacterium WGS1546]|uniref:glycoside hydrolase family 9 protein n=1 Tax=Cohnella sp. WGS1546 TaxID=3366810 RepID=UPI00372D100A